MISMLDQSPFKCTKAVNVFVVGSLRTISKSCFWPYFPALDSLDSDMHLPIRTTRNKLSQYWYQLQQRKLCAKTHRDKPTCQWIIEFDAEARESAETKLARYRLYSWHRRLVLGGLRFKKKSSSIQKTEHVQDILAVVEFMEYFNSPSSVCYKISVGSRPCRSCCIGVSRKGAYQLQENPMSSVDVSKMLF